MENFKLGFLFALFLMGSICWSVSTEAGTIPIPGQTIVIEEDANNRLGDQNSLAYFGDQIAYKVPGVERGYSFGQRWPSGDFVYQFNGQIEFQKNLFREVCERWATDTPLRCVERTTQSSYMRIDTHNGEGCGGNAERVSCSPVGFRPGVQVMEIWSGHWGNSFKDLLTHEIGHAIGFQHEHQRGDRDRFVNVVSDNIIPGWQWAFNILPGAPFSAYDYVSIMHYDNCELSKFLSSCWTGTEHNPTRWTLEPSHCDISSPLAGPSVSKLDLESVKKAYYGFGYSELFNDEAQLSCQTMDYSIPQGTYLYGPLVAEKFEFVWKRRNVQSRDSEGGFLVSQDPVKLCKARGQEFIRRWTDTDRHLTHKNFEEWTECGCPIVRVQHSCTKTSGKINRDFLLKVAGQGSNFAKEVLAIHDAISGMKDIRSVQILPDSTISKFILATSLFSTVPPEEFLRLNRPTARMQIEKKLHQLRLEIESKQISADTNPMLLQTELNQIFEKHGLRVPELN